TEATTAHTPPLLLLSCTTCAASAPRRRRAAQTLGAFCISTMTSFYVSLATLLCSRKARNFVFRPGRMEY
ncbi:Os02g0603150, partial [Oryza sativa Japonica Group]